MWLNHIMYFHFVPILKKITKSRCLNFFIFVEKMTVIDFTHFFEGRTNVNKPSEIKQPLIKHSFYDINIFLQKQQSNHDMYITFYDFNATYLLKTFQKFDFTCLLNISKRF